MAYCYTWVIVQACRLLRAPSLGRVPQSISSGLAAFFQATATNSCRPNTLQQVSSSPPTHQCLPLCLSFYQTQASKYCSVIYLCWSLTLFLWQCTLSDPVSPFSSSFSSSASLPPSLPPSHPALGSLSVICLVCDFRICPEAAVDAYLCCIWHYLNFPDIWIYSLMRIKMLEAILERKTPPPAFALNVKASGLDLHLCCRSKIEKKIVQNIKCYCVTYVSLGCC